MQTGWLNLGGTWYWLDASGAMATGWRVVDGSWNYFMANGAWVSDYMDAKAQSYSSNTNWLILVDTSRCLSSIYTGSRGNWSLNRRYVCSTGKASTPTVLGGVSGLWQGLFLWPWVHLLLLHAILWRLSIPFVALLR